MTFYEKIKKLCRTSLFISLLMRLVNVVYDCLRDGLFGRLMLAYPAEERLFRKGVVGSFFSKRGTMASWLRRVRLRLAEFFEKSFLLGVGLKKATYLLGCSLRVYGIFLLTFGAYSILVYYIKYFAFANMVQDSVTLTLGIISIVLSIPMLGCRHSVAELLSKGLLSHLLLVDVFGIPEERFELPRVPKGGRYNVALFLGMIAGILTFLIPPRYLILFILSLIVMALVMSYPEVGVLALIALMPFLSYSQGAFRALEFGIALTAIAYLGKLIRGKRVIRFSLVDVLVLLLGLLLYLSGAVAVGGEESARQVGHLCLFLVMYFMVVNLMRTPAWLHRAMLAGVGSASLLAVTGIFQYLNGGVNGQIKLLDVSVDWLRITSVFASPNALAAYLVLFLPLVWAVFITASDGKCRMIATGCIISFVIALMFTWSKGAWAGALVGLLLFFLIYSRKTACWIAIWGLTVPVWMYLIPSDVWSRYFSIVDITSSEIHQRLCVWKGTLQMLKEYLFGGIGYGAASFGEAYPLYAMNGITQVENPDQFYLSLMCAFGLFGLLVFAIVITVFAQHCFSYIGNASENYSRTFVAAGYSGVLGALIMGYSCDIWQDKIVFLTFFTVFALTCAYIRTGIAIRTRNQDVSGTDVSHAHVDLQFDN